MLDLVGNHIISNELIHSYNDQYNVYINPECQRHNRKVLCSGFVLWKSDGCGSKSVREGVQEFLPIFGNSQTIHDCTAASANLCAQPVLSFALKTAEAAVGAAAAGCPCIDCCCCRRSAMELLLLKQHGLHGCGRQLWSPS